MTDGLVVGADTHKDVHVAAVLDQLGRRPAVRQFPATDAGNTAVAGWLARLGQVTDAGVEGTGSYGYRLARLLAGEGMQVWEVNCPDRSRRRRKGKSDPVDAENAARRCWQARRPQCPRTGAAWPASCGCWCSPGAARSRLHGLRKARFGRACAGLEPADDLRRVLAVLGRRCSADDTARCPNCNPKK